WRNHLALFRAAIPDAVRWGSAFERERTNNHRLSCPERATRPDTDWSEGGKGMRDGVRRDRQGVVGLTLVWLVGGMLGGDCRPQPAEAQPDGTIIYKPPKRGAPGGREGAGTRGFREALPTLAVLAPQDHTGLTAQEQPVLYWYLSQETRQPVEVILTDWQSV